MNQQVAGFAQEDEAIGLDGFEVVDPEVVFGPAGDAGRQVNPARFDKPEGLLADSLSFYLPVTCSFASSFQTDGTCGTIYRNHVGTSLGCRLARAGSVFVSPSRLALRIGGATV
jgi:hypothetical protein